MYDEDQSMSPLARAHELRDQPFKIKRPKSKANKKAAGAGESIEPCYINLPSGNQSIKFTAVTITNKGVELHGRSSAGWAISCRVRPGPTPSEPAPAAIVRAGRAESDED